MSTTLTTPRSRLTLESLEQRLTPWVNASYITEPIAPGHINGYEQMASGDFDRDGFADLIVRDPSSGANRVVYGRGLQVVSNPIAPGHINGYEHMVTGDFNGDGHDDVFVWSPGSGGNRIAYAWGREFPWVVDNPVPAGAINGGGYSRVVAGDFDGDRRDDLLFWHSSGENRIAFARGSGFNVVTNRLGRGAVNGYDDVVTGDFDGDRRDDILFWHRSSGSNRIAFARGNEDFSIVTDRIEHGSVNGYDQMTTGDFNGDGRDDVLFRKVSNGDNRIAFAHGREAFYVMTNRLSPGQINHYEQMVTGDFGNDGRDDVGFRAIGSGSNRFARSDPAFNITLRMTGLTTKQEEIFWRAAARWAEVIIGELPDATYGVLVDDLLIDASVVAIDGPKGTLGQAAPDKLRGGSYLPYHGWMQFDSADLAEMADGSLYAVALHEMGHVLGVGSIWSYFGLLAGAGTSNPRFIGTQATAEYNNIFGTSATGVPVENTGGSGTRDSHWRESVFGNELMTGYLNSGSNPLSRVTVASLADMGYQVNLAAADRYPRSFSDGPVSDGRSGGGGLAGLKAVFSSAAVGSMDFGFHLHNPAAADLAPARSRVLESAVYVDGPAVEDTSLELGTVFSIQWPPSSWTYLARYDALDIVDPMHSGIIWGTIDGRRD
jgi:hypothetical protein